MPGSISIHAPLAGRDREGVVLAVIPMVISIHAPLAGRDIRCCFTTDNVYYFNPRAPCGARLGTRLPPRYSGRYFNPRAPCGARLCKRTTLDVSTLFQSTRPLRGATQLIKAKRQKIGISIHAPLAGRDRHFGVLDCNSGVFQSTRPLRGATTGGKHENHCDHISIHAPLAGRDLVFRSRKNTGWNFNPRAPCGARLNLITNSYNITVFQSTRPLRGATSKASDVQALQDISIHAPLAGRDENQ